MTDDKFFPKEKKNMQDRKGSGLQKPAGKSFFRSIIPETVANKHAKAKVDSAADLVASQSRLGEERLNFEQVKNKLINVDQILETDDMSRYRNYKEEEAKAKTAERSIDEADRDAMLKTMRDEIAATDAAIELEKKKQELENIRNPKPQLAQPEEKDDPVSNVESKLDSDEKLTTYMNQKMKEYEQMLVDGGDPEEVQELVDSLKDAIAKERRKL